MELSDGLPVKMYNNSTNYIPVRVAKMVAVSANTLTFVKCKADISLLGNDVEVQAAGKVASHDHLFLPHSVTQSDNKTVNVAK